MTTNRFTLQKFSKPFLTTITFCISIIGEVVPAHAVFIGNTQGGAEFPQGAVSFADAVIGFTVDTQGGTGLGLTVVQTMVKAHGGDLSVG